MENSAQPVLRSLRIGELFDQAIRIYRRNFFTFVGMIAIVYIPTFILQTSVSVFWVASSRSIDSTELIFSPAYWLFLLGSFTSGIISTILVGGLGHAALANATNRSYMNQKIGLIDSYRQLGTSWLHLVFVSLMLGILTLGLVIWTLVPLVGWLTGLGILFVLNSMAGELLAPITVIEKKTWFAPIPRAWDLARRRFWWLLGVIVLIILFEGFVIVGPILLVQSLIRSFLGPGLNTAILATLLPTLFGGIIQLIVLPVVSIIRTLIYFDLRIRTEGFDLALASIETPENTEIDIAQIPIPPSSQNWLTWDDIIRFLILSLALFTLLALFTGVLMLLISFLGVLL